MREKPGKTGELTLECKNQNMAYRRYRRKRSHTSRLLSDTSYVANRLSWKACIIFGIFFFLLFYFLIPMWINSQLNSLHNQTMRPILEAFFVRRIHWVQWVGIAIGLICTFFAIRNYFAADTLDWRGEKNVSLFSRILAKFLD